MAQEPEATAGIETFDQQPSSPASTSSREDTRDARERLKKTSIAGLQKATANTDYDTAADQNGLTEPSSNGRGRPSKKRSFEDLAKDGPDADGANALPDAKRSDHKRVRSVDVKTNEHANNYTKMDADATNTVHEGAEEHQETGADAEISPGGPGVLVEAPSQQDMAASNIAQQRSEGSANASETAGEHQTKVSPSTGFANTSSTSPFGQPSPSKAKEKVEITNTTSNSAFSSSGLAAFASSEKSPFGAAAGAKSPLGTGGFSGGSTAGGFGSAKGGFGSSSGFASTSTSTFGGGQSTFGSAKPFGATSAFGTPKPFGSTSGFGSGGSSFAAGKPIGGAVKSDDDDEGDEKEDDDDAASSANDGEQDPRFHQQQVDTGEEGEEVHFSARARLYFFEGAWKERGTGLFKVNIRYSEEETAEATEDPEAQASSLKRKARMLMRADATHRVLLNSPIFKGMRFGAPDGSKPTGKIMHLQSLENGKPVPLQIKIGKEDVLDDLYHRLLELEAEA